MNENLDYKFIDNKSDKTIIFLHGWGLNKNSFLKIINGLSDNCNILYLDFFGFGNSPEPQYPYDTYEYAYQIFMLICKLNLKKIYLVGHSFGGRISIILSSIFDIKIHCILLTSSAGLNRFNIIKFIKIRWFKFIKKLVKLKLLHNNKLNGFGSNDYQQLSNKMKLIFIKIVNQDLSYLLSKIECKTLLVWDRKDAVTPIWICNKMFRQIKHTQKYLFKNGGHFTFFYNTGKLINIVENMTFM